MQLCNMQLMQLYNNFVCNYMQIFNYMQLCNFMQKCNLCNYMQLYATILQYATICKLCNYMQLYATYATILQLNATICNCVGTTNVYWHDNLSSCFRECRYHQIGICRIYLPRVMIKIY
jgi:hypothetical protein